MDLRMIELVLPENLNYTLDSLFNGYQFADLRQERVHENKWTLVKGLHRVEDTEPLLGIIADRLKDQENFRVIVHAVERVKPEPGPPAQEVPQVPPQEPEVLGAARSEDLYGKVQEMGRVSWIYTAMTAVAVLAACLGASMNNLLVILGALAVAPLWSTVLGLSLSLALGDLKLAGEGALSLASAMVVTLAVTSLFGKMILLPDPLPYMTDLSTFSFKGMALAFCGGLAVCMALTSGRSTSLTGFLITITILPSLIISGLLLGQGQMDGALQSLLAFAGYLICAALAGVAVFLIQGFRPMSWWDSEKALVPTLVAMISWGGMCLILMTIIQYS